MFCNSSWKAGRFYEGAIAVRGNGRLGEEAGLSVGGLSLDVAGTSLHEG